MPHSTEIQRALPRLRRFARASCGDRELADTCVKNVLETLVSDRDALFHGSPIDLQVQLLRLVEHQLEIHAGNEYENRCWRALILVCIEGCSPQEAAHVLDVELVSVRQMIAAGECMAARLKDLQD